MEVKRKRRFIRDLSLKWSFALYVLICVAAALVISVSLSGLFQALRSGIWESYAIRYKDVIARETSLVTADGETLTQGGVWVYNEPLENKFDEADAFLYDFYNAMTTLIVPIMWIICIIITGVIYYKKKMKKPLAMFRNVSERITAGDLDFHIGYDRRDEFGRLAGSFEAMRAALYANNREMWGMAEGRKRLNAAFSHDLRTPLTVLRGYCDFLLKYAAEGKIDREKTVSTLNTMDAYIRRLEGYTDVMSSLQKLEELKAAPRPADFGELRAEFEEAARALSGGKNVKFRCEGGGRIEVDGHIVFRVYENLIANAAAYAVSAIGVDIDAVREDAAVPSAANASPRRKGVEPPLFPARQNAGQAWKGHKNGYLRVTVADDGPGFSPEALANASQAFYRADKDMTGGHFGIGLYVCGLLCKKHGGELLIENDGGGKVTASFALL